MCALIISSIVIEGVQPHNVGTFILGAPFLFAFWYYWPVGTIANIYTRRIEFIRVLRRSSYSKGDMIRIQSSMSPDELRRQLKDIQHDVSISDATIDEIWKVVQTIHIGE